MKINIKVIISDAQHILGSDKLTMMFCFQKTLFWVVKILRSLHMIPHKIGLS